MKYLSVMADGCIDTTDVTGPLKQKFCSPYIACNLIGDAVGVLCVERKLEFTVN